MAASFRRVAILGTGLIGGSFALALRKYAPGAVVAGWDKEHVLRHAHERGAIDEGFGELPLARAAGIIVEGCGELPLAVAGADLIYVVLPVGHTFELLPELARLDSPQTRV